MMREFGPVSGFGVRGQDTVPASQIKTESEDETMLSSATRIPLLVAAIALAACDGSAAPTAVPNSRAEQPVGALSNVGGSERIVEESLYDMSGSSYAIECQDGQLTELVALQGRIFERWTLLYNASGGIHLGYHTMPVGLVGVGTESGEEYRVKEQEHGSFRQTLMGATGSYRQSLRLQSRTSARSFEMVVRGHYTVNANGEIAVVREKPVVAC